MLSCSCVLMCHIMTHKRQDRKRRSDTPKKIGASLARHVYLVHAAYMPPTKSAGSPDLIGSQEAARLLGKSARTIHRLVSSGDLKPYTIAPGGYAGAYLFARADIEALLAERAAS